MTAGQRAIPVIIALTFGMLYLVRACPAPAPDPRIAALESRIDFLSDAMAQAERDIATQAARRVEAERAQAQAERRTRDALSHAAAVTRDSEQALRDMRLDTAALRAALSRQVTVTHDLRRLTDSLLDANVQARLAAAAERTALVTQLTRATAAIAARDSLLALQPDPCRLGPWPCPSRRSVALLTFITTLSGAVLLSR